MSYTVPYFDNGNHSTVGATTTANYVMQADSSGVPAWVASASLPDGLVGTPGLYWTSDTDTGFYRIGDNNIGVTVGGTKILDIASTGATVTGTITATDNVSMTKSVNGNAAFLLTNSNTGANTSSIYQASNGTSSVRFGRKGTSATAFGALTTGCGFFYSSDGDFAFMADTGGTMSFASGGSAECARSFLASAARPVWRFGFTSYNYASTEAALEIGYTGTTTQDGISLRPQSDTTTPVLFTNASGTTVGSISQTTTTTAYNTSSDRRRKQNIADLPGSGAIIDALKPRIFTWAPHKSVRVVSIDPVTRVPTQIDMTDVPALPGAGFIADELQAVLPSAVQGQANAVDAQGNPVYQMVSYCDPALIAAMVAELQSLRARVAFLEQHLPGPHLSN